MNDNVANNSLNCNTALLTYIATAAHEQDFKEAILAYFVLWRCGAPGLEKTALDAAAEFVIHRCFKQQLDFEVRLRCKPWERDKCCIDCSCRSKMRSIGLNEMAWYTKQRKVCFAPYPSHAL